MTNDEVEKSYDDELKLGWKNRTEEILKEFGSQPGILYSKLASEWLSVQKKLDDSWSFLRVINFDREIFSIFFEFFENRTYPSRNMDQKLLHPLSSTLVSRKSAFFDKFPVQDEVLKKFIAGPIDISITPDQPYNYVVDNVLNLFGLKSLYEYEFRYMDYVPSVRTSIMRLKLHNDNSFLNSIVMEIMRHGLSTVSTAFMNKYLVEFQIADEIEIRPISGSFGYELFVKSNGKYQNVVDLGHGISQLFPILLQIARTIDITIPKLPFWDQGRTWYICYNYTILIEEPETNLHPALQSKLADMFIECHEKYNIRFILETHSEYLIRKFQYHVAKKNHPSEDIVVYYFNSEKDREDTGKNFKRIDIQEDGSLSDEFGKGFFDEADNLAIDLFLLKKSQTN
jgi:hypothetical protein